MQIKTTFTLNIHDFRKATYYGLFVRYILALRLMVLVIVGSLAYAAAGYLGYLTVSPLLFFVAAAYLVWAALVFGKAERSMRLYMKSEQSLLGCTYQAELTKPRIQLQVPERHINATFSTGDLYCVFELSALFLLYVSPQEVYILPKRALSEEETTSLRDNFQAKLGKRFRTRFGDQAQKKSGVMGLLFGGLGKKKSGNDAKR